MSMPLETPAAVMIRSVEVLDDALRRGVGAELASSIGYTLQ